MFYFKFTLQHSRLQPLFTDTYYIEKLWLKVNVADCIKPMCMDFYIPISSYNTFVRQKKLFS
jgi:hypothetical protein